MRGEEVTDGAKVRYGIKVDLFLRAPIMLWFEDEREQDEFKWYIAREMREGTPIHIDGDCGCPGDVIINPAYIRTVEEVEE